MEQPCLRSSYVKKPHTLLNIRLENYNAGKLQTGEFNNILEGKCNTDLTLDSGFESGTSYNCTMASSNAKV